MIETDLLALFIRRAPFVCPTVRLFRRNIIKRKVVIDGRSVMLVNGIPGQGDAEAIVRGGRHIEIETKAAKGRMRAAQKRWQAWCLKWEVPHLKLQARAGETPEETVERWCIELRGAL
jgi:hypothetical protein